MRFDETMARIPESLRGKLSAHPLIVDRLSADRPLERTLDRVWARRWATHSSPAARDLLRWLVRQYGALPFAAAEAESLALIEPNAGWTGAELRTAMLRLRLDGVLFAARKLWGDRLLYIPSDYVGLWHSVLYTEELIPLELEEEGRRIEAASVSRIPLSRQLLKVWADIRQRGLPLTASGAPYKTNASKLVAAMEITPEELGPLLGTLSGAGTPIQTALALALDAGLELGILHKGQNSIEAGDGDGLSWFNGTMENLDTVLHSFIVSRYAPVNAGIHYAALSLSGMEPCRWYGERELRSAFGIAEGRSNEAGWEAWIRLASELGWLERGLSGEVRALRWRMDPSVPASPPSNPVYVATEQERVFIQTDLELIVPPETRFRVRWLLEEIGERIALDTVSTYRLTRDSCARASRLGFSLERIVEALEQAAGEPLSGLVRSTLADWLHDPQAIAPVKPIEAERRQEGAIRVAPDADACRWLLRPEPLREYELDGSFPPQEELFPGLQSIPATWLTQTRSYHVSTRKELVERALSWRTSLRIGSEADGYSFVPERIEQEGERWTVVGRARERGDGVSRAAGRMALQLDSLNEIKLELPSLQ